MRRVSNRWRNCTRCKLHKFRRNVVMGRGLIPASVLFLGIGPGKAEDLTGEAFRGPSGRVYEQALRDALADQGMTSPPSIYLTNIVACRPCDGVSEENRDPEPDEVLACRPRLAETVAHVRPDRVVFLGDFAQTEGKALCPDGVKLRHPAYLAREGGRGTPEYRRFVRDLGEILHEAQA